MKTLTVLAVLLALTPALSACGKGSDPLFDAKVRAYLLEHPEVIEEAMIKLDQDRTAKALATAQAKAKATIPVHRAALERDARDFVANPSGKITVTQFFDYRCGYCKVAAPQVVKLIAENPDVRVVFKELPILSAASHQAAQTALAAHTQGQYLEIYNGLFAAQSVDDETIDRVVTKAGLNPAEVKAAGQGSGIQRHLLDTQALATAIGVNGTPAFIIGDEMIAGADLDAVKAAVARERKRLG